MSWGLLYMLLYWFHLTDQTLSSGSCFWGCQLQVLWVCKGIVWISNEATTESDVSSVNWRFWQQLCYEQITCIIFTHRYIVPTCAEAKDLAFPARMAACCRHAFTDQLITCAYYTLMHAQERWPLCIFINWARFALFKSLAWTSANACLGGWHRSDTQTQSECLFTDLSRGTKMVSEHSIALVLQTSERFEQRFCTYCSFHGQHTMIHGEPWKNNYRYSRRRLPVLPLCLFMWVAARHQVPLPPITPLPSVFQLLACKHLAAQRKCQQCLWLPLQLVYI